MRKGIRHQLSVLSSPNRNSVHQKNRATLYYEIQSPESLVLKVGVVDADPWGSFVGHPMR